MKCALREMCDLSSVVSQKKQFISIYFSVTAFLVFLLCSNIVPSVIVNIQFTIIRLTTGFILPPGASVFLGVFASNGLGCMFSRA